MHVGKSRQRLFSLSFTHGKIVCQEEGIQCKKENTTLTDLDQECEKRRFLTFFLSTEGSVNQENRVQ